MVLFQQTAFENVIAIAMSDGDNIVTDEDTD